MSPPGCATDAPLPALPGMLVRSWEKAEGKQGARGLGPQLALCAVPFASSKQSQRGRERGDGDEGGCRAMNLLPAGESDFGQRAEDHRLPEADEGGERLLQEFNFADSNVGCFGPWRDLPLKPVSQLEGKGCSSWAPGCSSRSQPSAVLPYLLLERRFGELGCRLRAAFGLPCKERERAARDTCASSRAARVLPRAGGTAVSPPAAGCHPYLGRRRG